MQVARRLERVCDGVTVVRLGGDEFALLLAVCDRASALHLAQGVVDTLGLPFAGPGAVLSIGASVGVRLTTMQDEGAEVLLRDADTAIYHAKRSGKGRVSEYEPGMHEEVVRRLALQRDLRDAIGTDQLFLAYQPVLRLADHARTHAEALVRWTHPERGLLPPLEFIGLAEESGLIVPLGAWVLQEACCAAAAWQGAPGGRGVGVAVNVSLRQVSGKLLDTVDDALARAGLPAALLTVEITESVLADDPESADRFLAGLRARGVRIALDDFGTGHSSLASLSRYPLDVLKIDKAFVDDVAEQPRARHMVEAIIGMGRALGLETVAEGIEHPAQAETLAVLGCDAVQGYHYDRPLTPAQLLERFRASRATAAA